VIEAIVEMGSEEAPLLLPAPVVEGCPGCAIERQKASSKGRIPYRELFFVGVTSFASSLHNEICSIGSGVLFGHVAGRSLPLDVDRTIHSCRQIT